MSKAQETARPEPPIGPRVRVADLASAFLYGVLRKHLGTDTSRRGRRDRFSLMMAGSMEIAIGAGWFVVYLGLGNPLGMALMAFNMACGAGVLVLVKWRRLLAANLSLHLSLLISLSAVCLWLDVPGDHSPRAAHLYFPSLALSSYFLFGREHAWISRALMAAFLGAFLFFSATQFAFETPLALPPEVQRIGVWVNAVCSVLVLLGITVLLQVKLQTHSDLLGRLRGAIMNAELELFYQPIVDGTGAIVGAEALLRWRHPRMGLLSPDAFITLAETTGLIHPIGSWALWRACEDLARWRADPAVGGVPVNVNVSASQLLQASFAEDVLTLMRRSGAPPNRLKLELTESSLLHNREQVVRTMNQLALDGIGFSLDDFGTGFSSLSYLRQLPLQCIKIDREFVSSMNTPRGAAVIDTLLMLAEKLELDVVAEGVETVEQWDYLRARGCTRFQGYLFSRPLDRGGFEALLSRQLAQAAPA